LESWPSILVAEYNASFGLSNLVINPKYNFTNELEEEKNMQLYGASLVALTNLAKKHGLELVYCDQSGTNAFFVSKNSLPTLIPKQPHEVFRDSARSLKFKSRRLNHSAYIERGILVEV